MIMTKFWLCLYHELIASKTFCWWNLTAFHAPYFMMLFKKLNSRNILCCYFWNTLPVSCSLFSNRMRKHLKSSSLTSVENMTVYYCIIEYFCVCLEFPDIFGKFGDLPKISISRQIGCWLDITLKKLLTVFFSSKSRQTFIVANLTSNIFKFKFLKTMSHNIYIFFCKTMTV